MPKQAINDYRELFNEIRLVFHQLARIAESLHEAEGISAGQRGVLEIISRRGPIAVPAMALERHVSRQLIQALVDELKQKGLVEDRSNPAHKRSSLIAMTASGLRLWKKMSQRETQWLQSASSKLSGIAVTRMVSELQKLRSALAEAQEKGVKKYEHA